MCLPRGVSDLAATEVMTTSDMADGRHVIPVLVPSADQTLLKGRESYAF